MQNSKLEIVLEKIQAIPPLSAAVEKLCQMAKDPDAEVKEMSQIITSDPALTSKILKIANSAFYGLSRHIGTVSQAIMIIGFQGVRNLAVDISILGVWNHKSTKEPISREQFWRHSLATAISARQLATKIGLASPEEAFTAGLLHDIGKVVFIEHFPEEYREILRKLSEGTKNLTELEKETFGMNHTEVGSKLCQHWKIPQFLSLTTSEHHLKTDNKRNSEEENRLIHLIKISNNLAKLAQIGFAGNSHIETDFISEKTNFHGAISEPLCQTMLTLPEEIRKVEVFFSMLPDTQDSVETVLSDSNIIGVVISNQAAFEIISLSLIRLGYSPTDLDSLDTKDICAVISDDTLLPETMEHLKSRKIPILNFVEWSEYNSINTTGLFNIQNFKSWIEQNLSLK